MSEMMQCPICGREFPAFDYESLDNENPACPECVRKEQEDLEKKEHQKK